MIVLLVFSLPTRKVIFHGWENSVDENVGTVKLPMGFKAELIRGKSTVFIEERSEKSCLKSSIVN